VGAEGNPFFVADASRVPELEAFMDKLRKSGDSCGARLTVVATGVPAGWGEPLYGRLDADIAKAMMGINASNNAGGILGGISTGQDIVVSVAIKPTSSIRLPRKTIDIEGNAATIETHGRHRATPIAEAFPTLVLIDHALRQRAQNGDVKGAVRAVAGKVKRSKSNPQGKKLEDPDPLEA
jgi:chorismate synthase